MTHEELRAFLITAGICQDDGEFWPVESGKTYLRIADGTVFPYSCIQDYPEYKEGYVDAYYDAARNEYVLRYTEKGAKEFLAYNTLVEI